MPDVQDTNNFWENLFLNGLKQQQQQCKEASKLFNKTLQELQDAGSWQRRGGLMRPRGLAARGMRIYENITGLTTGVHVFGYVLDDVVHVSG